MSQENVVTLIKVKRKDHFCTLHSTIISMCIQMHMLIMLSDYLLLGSVSDGIAAEFSDLVDDLISRIPYLLVSISTLLPRFDRDDQVSNVFHQQM